MKRLLSPKIIFLLLPLILTQALNPRIGESRLYDLLAKQPVFVYSFVWVPLMEISILVMERVILPINISVPEKNTEKQTPSAAEGDTDYSQATPSNIYIAASRMFNLSALNILNINKLINCVNVQDKNAIFVILPLFAIYFFRKQCIQLSKPSLPRGDVPALLC